MCYFWHVAHDFWVVLMQKNLILDIIWGVKKLGVTGAKFGAYKYGGAKKVISFLFLYPQVNKMILSLRIKNHPLWLFAWELLMIYVGDPLLNQNLSHFSVEKIACHDKAFLLLPQDKNCFGHTNVVGKSSTHSS